MVYQRATIDDISSIISLHQLTLPQTTSSKIGSGYLRVLYLLCINSSHRIVYLAKEDEKIVGVISATIDISRLTTDLMPFFPKVVYYVAHALVKKRITLLEIVRKARFENTLVSEFGKPYASILTVCVHPTYQRHGIGKQLMEHMFMWYSKKGIKTFYVDTEVSNTKAQQFYKKAGGTYKKTILDAKIFMFSV